MYKMYLGTWPRPLLVKFRQTVDELVESCSLVTENDVD